MLNLGSDAQVGRTYGQTSSRSKLRDSCHPCAVSKVKCPKEKPSCSKCEYRGITCQYFFAKRPGRRRENSASNGNYFPSSMSVNKCANSYTNAGTDTNVFREWDTIPVVQPSLEACFLSGSTIIPTSLRGPNRYLRTPPSLSVPSSPKQDNAFAADPNRFAVLGKTSVLSGLADFGSEVNDVEFVMSAIESPFELLGMDGGRITQTPNDIASILMPTERTNIDHASSATSSPVELLSASSGVFSLASNAQSVSTGNTNITRATDTSLCECLAQALDLLKTLSSTQSSSRTPFPSPESTASPNTINVDSTQTVLLENKQVIEAVSSNLACLSCAGDSFLLAVICMIVMKILERYAAAARAQQHHGTRIKEMENGKATWLPNDIITDNEDWAKTQSWPNNMTCDDKPSGRMATQLVLRELHRVQRLVNQLSSKLRWFNEGGEQNLDPDLKFWARSRATGDGDKLTITPFSAGTLEQMERDVRRSLSSLSADLINVLRQS